VPGAEEDAMTTMLFETVHGSHLYGLAHEGSDLDMFRVVAEPLRRAEHSVDSRLFATQVVDTVRMGWVRFLVLAHSGAHQAVEAMFSPYKSWTEEGQWLKPVVERTRIAGPDVFAKYERTIRAFVFGDFKRRRHAVRLTLNLASLRECGRFNPAMDQHAIDFANELAEKYKGEELWTKLME
jgi:hypothetical protein